MNMIEGTITSISATREQITIHGKCETPAAFKVYEFAPYELDPERMDRVPVVPVAIST